jgi:PAS domain S-box-containing protein
MSEIKNWKQTNKEYKPLPLADQAFRNVIEAMSESVWVWDANERTIYANPNFCRLVEYSLEEMIWRESYVFWEWESIKKVKSHNSKRKDWERSKYEWILISKSWIEIPVFLSWTPLPWWGTAWIMTDLREVKSLQEAEEKLQKQLDEIIKLKKELDRQIEALNNASIVVETNPDLTITHANDYYQLISWFTINELIWKQFTFETPKKQWEDFLNEFLETIKTWNIWKWEFKKTWKDWNFYWLNSTVTPFLDNNWNIYKLVFINNDITDIKNLNETKDEFLNIASHELRTPMTSIKWYISMMLDWDFWDVNDEIKKQLEKVYKSTAWLIWLVNDMLDIAKLESWKMQFTDEKIKIWDFINDIYDDFKILANQKNIIFEKNVDHEIVDENIFIDVPKIKQVFINLIWNALKFTPEWKSITIKVQDNKDWNALFEIIDTWIWIPKSHIDKIFEKFKQVDNYLQRSVNGTWLWLSICKQIIANYWSNIKVSSEEWKWSTFYFYLPIQK